MIDREQYAPGPASGAQIRKDGDKWTLILVRELRHSPEKVWEALTDPTHLRQWAPFDADGSLATVGSKVKLTTVGAPTPRVTETTVTRADVPEVLECKWVTSTCDGNSKPWLRSRWLAPFRRFWSAHLDALERHLDRMDQSTPTKRKTRRKRRGPNRERDKGGTK